MKSKVEPVQLTDGVGASRPIVTDAAADVADTGSATHSAATIQRAGLA